MNLTTHPAGRSLPDLVLRNPDSLVAALPHLLGFAPQESAVLLWIHRGRLALTQRLDLPPAQLEVSQWPRLQEWLDVLWAPASSVDADEIIVILVSERTDLQPLSDAVLAQAMSEGMECRDSLRVSGLRWWSFMCTVGECCPIEGRVVPDAEAGRVAAEFTLLGSAPLPDREALATELAFDKARSRQVRDALTRLDWLRVPGRRSEAWRDRAIHEVVTPACDDDGALLREAVTQVGLGDVRVRDTVLWEATAMPPEHLHPFAAHLRACIRGARVSRRPPIATCAAVAAWLLGDGARAMTAIEVALDCDQDYALARMVEVALCSGMPPHEWRKCMFSLGRDGVRLRRG